MDDRDVTMSVEFPDGSTLGPFTDGQMADVARAMRGGAPLKSTAGDREVEARVYGVAAAELRQFIERFEQLEAEKKDLVVAQRDVMAEAKGRGYDTKVMRKVIARRKRKPDELAEEDAILEMYLEALAT